MGFNYFFLPYHIPFHRCHLHNDHFHHIIEKDVCNDYLNIGIDRDGIQSLDKLLVHLSHHRNHPTIK